MSLTNSRSGKFLKASGIRGRLGASLVRNLLNITLKKDKAQARKRLDSVDIEMNELSTDQKIETIEEVLPISVAVNTDLDMREFLGINKALTRIKRELENNAAKLSELDKHLEKEHKKLKEIEDNPEYDDEICKRIKSRIKNLNEERLARLEILSQNAKELASQFSRIHQTAEKFLDGDLSLKEKIKLVFREHGLTITAVLTAVRLIISTIITTLTSGSGSSPSTPKHPNKLKEWVKSKLKALARLLGRLAGKASAALPGTFSKKLLLPQLSIFGNF